jgi:hypothetical protein
MPEVIYGRKDVADTLGVRPPVLSNWIVRYVDWPRPRFNTPDGVMYWDLEGTLEWREWYFKHTEL